MKKTLFTKLLAYGCILFLSISCKSGSQDDPTPDSIIDDNLAHITIDVDWSLMDETPSGMTVLFYPMDGSKYYQYLTNNVHHIEQALPEKKYDILVFNQSIDEFTTLSFRGIDKLETAEVYIAKTTETSSRLDRLYKGKGRGYSTTARTKPKSFGGGRARSSGDESDSDDVRSYSSKKIIKPTPKVGQLSATIYVRGLDNALAANGALTGLASGCFFATDKLSSESLTQEIESLDINLSDGSSVGTITTVIGTFGISPNVDINATTTRNQETEMNYVEASEEDDYRNILYLNILLKDYSYVSYRFDVTKYIKNYTTDKEITLDLNLGTNLEEYLSLPSTGLPYKSTPVTIDPWSDEPIDHNVTL